MYPLPQAEHTYKAEHVAQFAIVQDKQVPEIFCFPTGQTHELFFSYNPLLHILQLLIHWHLLQPGI